MFCGLDLVSKKRRSQGKADPPVIRPARPCLGQAQLSSRGDVAGNFSMLARCVEVWRRWPVASQVLALILAVRVPSAELEASVA